MYCRHCGQEVKDEAIICPHCGCETGVNNAVRPKENDAKSAGWAVLCFFFPIIGLILYLVWKDEYPLRAKSCGKGALISVIVSVALVVLYIVLLIVIISVAAGGAGGYYM